MQSNQRGGIASFIVVTLVLVGLLAGGLYLSKTQARQARDTAGSSGQVAEEAPKKSAETPADDTSGEQGTTTEESTPSASKPEQGSETPAAKPAPAAPSTNRVANTGPSESIPATGSGDVFAYLVGLVALVYTSYQLVQSRRLVRENALKR